MFVDIPTSNTFLDAELIIPAKAKGVIVFVHGSGSSRHSLRNKFVAEVLRESGFATLLFDLLRPEEELYYGSSFDIELMSNRLKDVLKWLKKSNYTKGLSLNLFGASTGAAVAINVASELGEDVILSLVSRGGRPDLAFGNLKNLKSATFFIVGGEDYEVLEINKKAYKELVCKKKIEIIEGASHLFQEAGALGEVAQLARDWFLLNYQDCKSEY